LAVRGYGSARRITQYNQEDITMQRKLLVATAALVSVVVCGCAYLPIPYVVDYDYVPTSAGAPYGYGPGPYAFAPYWDGDNSDFAGWGGYGDDNYAHGMHPWGNWRERFRRDRVGGGLYAGGIGFHGDGLLQSSVRSRRPSASASKQLASPTISRSSAKD
jgi:hypothetical protein